MNVKPTVDYTSVTETATRINWPAVPGYGHYQIHLQKNVGGTWSAFEKVATVTTLTYLFTNLTPGTTYSVRVVCGDDALSYANGTGWTTKGTSPTAPPQPPTSNVDQWTYAATGFTMNNIDNMSGKVDGTAWFVGSVAGAPVMWTCKDGMEPVIVPIPAGGGFQLGACRAAAFDGQTLVCLADTYQAIQLFLWKLSAGALSYIIQHTLGGTTTDAYAVCPVREGGFVAVGNDRAENIPSATRIWRGWWLRPDGTVTSDTLVGAQIHPKDAIKGCVMQHPDSGLIVAMTNHDTTSEAHVHVLRINNNRLCYVVERGNVAAGCMVDGEMPSGKFTLTQDGRDLLYVVCGQPAGNAQPWRRHYGGDSGNLYTDRTDNWFSATNTILAQRINGLGFAQQRELPFDETIRIEACSPSVVLRKANGQIGLVYQPEKFNSIRQKNEYPDIMVAWWDGAKFTKERIGGSYWVNLSQRSGWESQTATAGNYIWWKTATGSIIKRFL